MLQQSKKLGTKRRAAAELASYGGRNRFAARLLHAARAHAQMLALHDDHNAMRRKLLVNDIRDLRCDSLLHLQPAGNRLYETGKLAESRYFAARDITDMRFPEEWRHMMLALAVIYDILDDDKLLMLLIERDAKHLARINLIAGKNFLIHPCYAGRRFQQAFTLYIFADKLQNFFYMVFDLLPVARLRSN